MSIPDTAIPSLWINGSRLGGIGVTNTHSRGDVTGIADNGIRLTRYNTLDYRTQSPKNVTLSRFTSVRLLEAWNILPIYTKAIMKRESFKKEIKEKILAGYHESVNCSDRSCPDCHSA